jgi:4-amino-4-deoxy-L-arabinose transferase-like glycosyltransferase
MDAEVVGSKRSWMILLAILLVGGLLRTVDLRGTPPGMNQDEASNAWNAYCLLRTGQDQAGVHWPIFSTRCLGENRSTLYIYYLIPFQAIGGLNIQTARFASAVGGIASLLLAYYVGKRLFGGPAGLVAAGLMALNPWHVQQSRWAHEAAIVPLLVLLPVAAWLWAGLPFADSKTGARPLRAALAGAITGVCCYGYPAVRLFMPVFLLLAVGLNWPAWCGWLRSRRGWWAGAAFGLGLAVTLGPLAWKHITEPEVMGKRLAQVRVWQEGDPFLTKVENALARYPAHFEPDFLFLEGDVVKLQSPPLGGMFHAYMMPLMALGLVSMVRQLRASVSFRVLLAWLAAYPAGDCLGDHPTAHALRSLPGLAALILLGTAGALYAAACLRNRPRGVWLCSGVTALAVAAINARLWVSYFGEYGRRAEIRSDFQVDLVKAVDWLRPKLDDVDAVFCTSRGFRMPYVITLVGLSYEPRQWFADPREMCDGGGWDLCLRYGKIRFVYNSGQWGELERFRSDGRPERIALVVRPGEVPGLEPAEVVRAHNGRELLWLCEAPPVTTCLSGSSSSGLRHCPRAAPGFWKRH